MYKNRKEQGKKTNLKIIEKLYQMIQIPKIVLLLIDIFTIPLAYVTALMLRYDISYSEIPYEFIEAYIKFMPYYVIISVVIFISLKLYNSIWKYAGTVEFLRVFVATVITSIIHIVCMHSIVRVRMPISYYVFGGILQFGLALGIRFSVRFLGLMRGLMQRNDHTEGVMLVGAGIAGRMVLRDIKRSLSDKYTVKCFIDDDKTKWGKFVEGVLIEGGRDNILEMVDKYSIKKIMVTISNIKLIDRRDLLEICNETGCEIMVLPAMSEIVNGQVSMATMKNVEVEDLLGRDAIKADMERIAAYVTGKVIMVTGGGGSIGSELCRQVAAKNPKKLIIFEIYENSAYDIEQELRMRYPNLDLVILIGSVRDSRRIFGVFDEYRPDIVYHAAAHKHVPLMETSPCEAIKNNAIGTYKTAYAAMMHGCKRFVLISTDKAVNPTNIMGASKRLCEMIVQSFDYMIKSGKASEIVQLFTHENTKMFTPSEVKEALKDSKTEFVAVRFGNVLGSNGSVIPLFKKQILKGGPVTVTHPDIIRYFMTIPEAVSLVMEAGAIAKGGEIFVLDMGEPVKIDTLARNLIKLSGYRPDVDIEIEYTGLRPGEKLFEEKLMEEEGLRRTENELIHIGSPIPFEVEPFVVQLDELMEAAYKNKTGIIRDMVEQVVTTYHPANN